MILQGIKESITFPKNMRSLLADVKGALERQGLSETDIKHGDAIFFRYGWSIFWDKPEQYNKPAPGIGMEVGHWVVKKNAAMVGSDQSGLEVGESSVPDNFIPVHQLLITQNGIWNLENLNFEGLVEDQVYQFLFIFTPVRFKGATGSPGRPIAIK